MCSVHWEFYCLILPMKRGQHLSSQQLGQSCSDLHRLLQTRKVKCPSAGGFHEWAVVCSLSGVPFRNPDRESTPSFWTHKQHGWASGQPWRLREAHETISTGHTSVWHCNAQGQCLSQGNHREHPAQKELKCHPLSRWEASEAGYGTSLVAVLVPWIYGCFKT